MALGIINSSYKFYRPTFSFSQGSLLDLVVISRCQKDNQTKWWCVQLLIESAEMSLFCEKSDIVTNCSTILHHIYWFDKLAYEICFHTQDTYTFHPQKRVFFTFIFNLKQFGLVSPWKRWSLHHKVPQAGPRCIKQSNIYLLLSTWYSGAIA